jgi:CRISPR system Cascade subunit CasC
MIVELHLLQNFAPSCLNRDDTNSPKDCDFGGYRRARISSQCIKRSVRDFFKANQENLGIHQRLGERSRSWPREMIKSLVSAVKDEKEARLLTALVLGGTSFWLDKKDSNRTSVLLFLEPDIRPRLQEAIIKYWDALIPIGQGFEKKLRIKEKEAEKESEDEAKGKETKKDKLANEIKAKLPSEIKQLLESIKTTVVSAVDIALFGRMIADLADMNIDAACQVAHALSTNQVSMEFDFYTAVDDLSPKEETGAGMMGTVEFNSACFYRYANIDFNQLTKNLGGDQDLARKAVEAFLTAAVKAVPTGKQNSMAAHNPPSFAFAVVRQHGLWSLANAFVEPVRPARDGHLVQKSITALENYWARLAAAYGEEGIQARAALAVDGELSGLKDYEKKSFQDVLDSVMAALPGGRP